MKQRNVGYAPEADDDFDWIYEIVSLASSPAIAFDYVRRLKDFCERLEFASERGNRRDDIRKGLRIVGFERRVTVAFAVDESDVTILRLFYGGQDWQETLRKS